MKKFNILLLINILILILAILAFYKIDNKIDKIGMLMTRHILKASKEIREVSVSTDNDYSEGAENAPVTIVMFSDYECGYCKSFFDEVFPKIQSNFISKGIVRFVIKDYPLERHENAFLAAQMVECAHKQGKFFEMHKLVMNNQYDISTDNFKIWSQQLGMDVESANACMGSQSIVSEIKNDIKDAKSAGIRGTPAFVINNKLYVGTKPYEKFESIILQEMEKSQNVCED